jgi:hypothetical protein
MPKKKTIERFALIEKEKLYSLTWKSLTDSARVIFLHLKGEYNGSNSDKLKLPYSQMKDIVSNATYWRGIKQLDNVGLIDIVYHGGRPCFKEGRERREANIYKLSERWRIKEKSIQEYQKEFQGRWQRKLYREYVERQLEQ